MAIAGVVTGRVLAGGSLTEAMGEVRVSGALRAAVQDLAYSALRDFGRGDAALGRLVVKRPTASLHGLLLAALAELGQRPRNPYAVVHQAVEAAARVAPRNAAKAKGLVNAVLRNFLRQQDALTASSQGSETGRYRHPQWWIDRLRAAWPHDWEGMLETANSPPPMILRVNVRCMNGSTYLALLADAGISAVLLEPQTLRLERPLPVDRLPAFFDGVVSVQDWGAQQAAQYLDVKAGMRVLDACAAPGGKAAHIAEIADCKLTATDADEKRLERIRGNLRRLGLHAKVLHDDALKPDAMLAGAPYDRILADVPCSASGVVRRHPDIKWLRRESDLPRFAEIQREMLSSLWRLLALGGKLLYATCSVFPEENELQIASFLHEHRAAVRLPLAAPPGSALAESWRNGAQFVPGPLNDGFFYALLEKRP
ncbi:MAG: 16S rRNA (cytosine(967)-C(5))-methyltransferase RsmB [Betaproteobacteria bacterium]|nr:16S rRNA (cytosine(967)-C(5))-methyltransferase RsmB [Betaproteobacteria bacterium]